MRTAMGSARKNACKSSTMDHISESNCGPIRTQTHDMSTAETRLTWIQTAPEPGDAYVAECGPYDFEIRATAGMGYRLRMWEIRPEDSPLLFWEMNGYSPEMPKSARSDWRPSTFRSSRDERPVLWGEFSDRLVGTSRTSSCTREHSGANTSFCTAHNASSRMEFAIDEDPIYAGRLPTVCQAD
jgi:hypothetical protein